MITKYLIKEHCTFLVDQEEYHHMPTKKVLTFVNRNVDMLVFIFRFHNTEIIVSL